MPSLATPVYVGAVGHINPTFGKVNPQAIHLVILGTAAGEILDSYRSALFATDGEFSNSQRAVRRDLRALWPSHRDKVPLLPRRRSKDIIWGRNLVLSAQSAMQMSGDEDVASAVTHNGRPFGNVDGDSDVVCHPLKECSRSLEDPLLKNGLRVEEDKTKLYPPPITLQDDRTGLKLRHFNPDLPMYRGKPQMVTGALLFEPCEATGRWWCLTDAQREALSEEDKGRYNHVIRVMETDAGQLRKEGWRCERCIRENVECWGYTDEACGKLKNVMAQWHKCARCNFTTSHPKCKQE